MLDEVKGESSLRAHPCFTYIQRLVLFSAWFFFGPASVIQGSEDKIAPSTSFKHKRPQHLATTATFLQQLEGSYRTSPSSCCASAVVLCHNSRSRGHPYKERRDKWWSHAGIISGVCPSVEHDNACSCECAIFSLKGRKFAQQFLFPRLFTQIKILTINNSQLTLKNQKLKIKNQKLKI